MSQPVYREARSRAQEDPPQTARRALIERFDAVRSFTLDLCVPLDPEDDSCAGSIGLASRAG